MAERYIRISKVIKEVNISLERAIIFLKDKGIGVEPTPNAKLSEKEYNLLVSEFSTSIGKQNIVGIENDRNQTVFQKESYDKKESLNISTYKALTEKTDISSYCTYLKLNPVNFKRFKIALSPNNEVNLVNDFSLAILKYIYANFLTVNKNLDNDFEITIKITTQNKIIVEQVLKLNQSTNFWSELCERVNILCLSNKDEYFTISINEVNINFKKKLSSSFSKIYNDPLNAHLTSILQDQMLLDFVDKRIKNKDNNLLKNDFIRSLLNRIDVFDNKFNLEEVNSNVKKYNRINKKNRSSSNHNTIFTCAEENLDKAYHNYTNEQKKSLILFGSLIFDGVSKCSTHKSNFCFFKNLFNHLQKLLNYYDEINKSYNLKIEIDNYHYVEVYSDFFSNNHLFSSFNVFESLLINNELDESAFWAILLNNQNLYSTYTDKFRSKRKHQNIVSDELPNLEKYNEENPFEEEIKEILQNKYATGKIIKTIKYINEILESQFTDFQAFHICKGLKDQRSLYNKYFANKHSEQDIFLAHTLANKLLKEKGKKMIDYIFTLPELPFKTDQFNILFSTLDKIRTEGKNDNPILRLNISNENNQREEIEFSFYSIDGTKYINQINVKNKSTRADIFSVTRTGKVLPKENKVSKSNNFNITPVLQFFYSLTESSDGFKEAVISYGKESGKCSVCGRKLEDEKSILMGIGPVCAGYLK